MAKNSIRDYDATSGNNTDIQSIDVSEGCPASGINNALRELMTDLKNVSTGAVALETPAADQLNVDNIRIDGNTISSTDTNGDISLSPSGTGDTNVDNGDFLFLEEAASSPYPEQKIKWSNDSTTANGFYVSQDTSRNGRVWHEQGVDLVFGTTNTERLRIDSSGNVGIGTASPDGSSFSVSSSPVVDISGTKPLLILSETDSNTKKAWVGLSSDVFYLGGTNTETAFYTDGSERMRIENSAVLMFKTATSDSTPGFAFKSSGSNNFEAAFIGSSDPVLRLNRVTSDGTLAAFQHATTTEGSITISGGTVSYNGGHLSRWSRLLDGSRPSTLLKGTVMSNLDDMIVWTGEDNEQLNHTKISDTEGDVNVAGVFVAWDDDDDDYEDFYLAMTGDMVIRIAQGTTVARGDLLMSAGDGTAKPQGDDIVRSKTIAKVTSTTVSHTYDDGSYLVPCVLMAC